MENPKQIFISYNSQDKRAVENVALSLKREGFELWLDEWKLIPGDKAVFELGQAIGESGVFIAFIGPSGLGPWQSEEVCAAISQSVTNPGYRLVPVLLPGADPVKRSDLPLFLSNSTWIEFQDNIDEQRPLQKLLAAVAGREPGPPLQSPDFSDLSSESPYRGLQIFDVEDHDQFFGRSALTSWLVHDIRSSLKNRTTRFLAVAGASGSGKSSLVRAGLIAELKDGAIIGSAKWRYALLKPGSDPLEALSTQTVRALQLNLAEAVDLPKAMLKDESAFHFQAAKSLPDNKSRLLCLVDQFEEIFTMCGDENKRRAFLNNLLYAAKTVDGPVTVVLTLRSDFIDKCANYPQLASVLSGCQEIIGPMSPGELRQAIERPAFRAGYGFEPGLVQTLLDDAGAQPGSLPLLQYALYELWRQHDQRLLTHRAYEAIGRLQGALAKRADEIYAGFKDPAQQKIVQRVFLRLIAPGEGTQDTRRRASLSEFSLENGDGLIEVIRKLADERLLVMESETVEVAHEALIQKWPQLGEWIAQNRENLREHRRITESAKEWELQSRDHSILYTGLMLDRAQGWRRDNEKNLSRLEQEFLDASAFKKRKLLAQQRKIIAVFLIIAVLAMLLGLLAVYMWWESDKQRILAVEQRITAERHKIIAEKQKTAAEEQRAVAEYQKATAEMQRLAGDSIAEQNRSHPLSLLLALAAIKKQPEQMEGYSALLAALQLRPKIRTYLNTEQSGAPLIAFNPDGSKLISASCGYNPMFSRSGYCKVMFWDVETGESLRELFKGHTDDVSRFFFSPDGSRLAAVNGDGTINLWDTERGERLGELFKGHESDIKNLIFSPDGSKVAAVNGDGTINLWDTERGERLGELFKGHESDIKNLIFSPDGSKVATVNGDGTINLWDAKKGEKFGELFKGHEENVIKNFVFSPDGSKLAIVDGYSRIMLWDLEKEKFLDMPLKGDSHYVNKLTFSHDGSLLATTNDNDSTVTLWDMKERKMLDISLKGNKETSVAQIAFSPDGSKLASANYDGTVILWNMEKGEVLKDILSGTKHIRYAFSHDGSTLAYTSDNNAIIMWDMKKKERAREPLKGYNGSVYQLAFSPDGSKLVSADDDGTLILWDLEKRKILDMPLKGHNRLVKRLVFSSDGSILVSASDDGTIILWDTKKKETMGKSLEGHIASFDQIAFNPDESLLAFLNADSRTINLWDVKKREGLGELLIEDEKLVSSISLNPDGYKLIAASAGDKIFLWNLEKKERLGATLKGHGYIYQVLFSPDGSLLASTDNYGVTLWDVEKKEKLGKPLRGDKKTGVYSAVFNPDGSIMASTSLNNEILLWDVKQRKMLGEPLTINYPDDTIQISFSPNGSILASASSSGRIFLWDVSPASWQKKACVIANRNLTCEEWREFMGDEPYQKICDGLPGPEQPCP